MKSVFTVLMLFFLVGCGLSDRPPMDEQTYKLIRAELEIIHTIHTYTGNTEHTAEMIADLKAEFNFTAEEFLISHRYYEKDLNAELARYERTIQSLTEERIRLEQHLRDEIERKQNEGLESELNGEQGFSGGMLEDQEPTDEFPT